MKVFGPIPSRRLGRSLGINNIPPKVCTYSCIYCQIGRTNKLEIERRTFYKPEKILKEAREKIKEVKKAGEQIDYLTFVADGEPTLDKNLGTIIQSFRPFGIKTAVITNSSLIWREDVREDLKKADWVSLKADAASEEIWRKVDRPRGSLKLSSIQQGMLDFAEDFSGQLVTETMLVKGVNDGEDNIRAVSDFLNKLKPDIAYLSIPTRPPAEENVQSPDEMAINRAYHIFTEKIDRVEYLIGYEGNAFAFTGNVEEDLLSITSVHPMREEAVKEFLSKAKSGWDTVDKLISENKLVELQYDEKKFYMRKLR